MSTKTLEMKSIWLSIFLLGIGCGGCEENGRVTQTPSSLPPKDALEKAMLHHPRWRLDADWMQAPIDDLRVIVTEKNVVLMDAECDETHELEESRGCIYFAQSIVEHVQIGPVPTCCSGEPSNYPVERIGPLPWYEKSHVRMTFEGRLFLSPCSKFEPSENKPLEWEYDEETGSLFFAQDMTCEDGSIETATWKVQPIECERRIPTTERFGTSECAQWRILDPKEL